MDPLTENWLDLFSRATGYTAQHAACAHNPWVGHYNSNMWEVEVFFKVNYFEIQNQMERWQHKNCSYSGLLPHMLFGVSMSELGCYSDQWTTIASPEDMSYRIMARFWTNDLHKLSTTLERLAKRRFESTFDGLMEEALSVG